MFAENIKNIMAEFNIFTAANTALSIGNGLRRVQDDKPKRPFTTTS